MENFEKIDEYHKIMESYKWVKEIPFIKFPSEWEIKIIPPFMGAVIRFIVKYKEVEISVYLDCYSNLGFVGQPYWEIYPYRHDTYRCFMNDTDELIEKIKESFDFIISEKNG